MLDIGGECPGHADDVVAVRVEPPPKKNACVPKGVMGPLSTPLDKLVDRHLFSLRIDETEQIALDRGRQEARARSSGHRLAPARADRRRGRQRCRTRLRPNAARSHGRGDRSSGPPSTSWGSRRRARSHLTKTGGGEGASDAGGEKGEHRNGGARNQNRRRCGVRASLARRSGSQADERLGRSARAIEPLSCAASRSSKSQPHRCAGSRSMEAGFARSFADRHPVSSRSKSPNRCRPTLDSRIRSPRRSPRCAPSAGSRTRTTARSDSPSLARSTISRSASTRSASKWAA